MRTAVRAGFGVLLLFAIGCGVSPRSTGVGSEPEASGPAPAATEAGSSAPAAAPVTLPEDQVFEGSGDKVVQFTLTAGFVHIVTITHSGSANFVVTALDASGGRLGLMVNEIGNYTGVRPLDFDRKPAALQIKADGRWMLTVQAAQKAPLWTGASSGTGAAVLRLSADALGAGMATATITHTGSANFVVKAWGDSRRLLINEIGNYSGEVILPRDAVLLEIEADGDWTVQKS